MPTSFLELMNHNQFAHVEINFAGDSFSYIESLIGEGINASIRTKNSIVAESYTGVLPVAERINVAVSGKAVFDGKSIESVKPFVGQHAGM